MKLLNSILFFIITIFSFTNIYSQNTLSNGKAENCFSKTNFDIVYQYIEKQIKKGDTAFYKFYNYQLYLTSSTDISFKKNEYTLSKISKDNGVVSLAKRKKDNKKILKETNQIFCKILLLSEKK